jgi:hypothetical protein
MPIACYAQDAAGRMADFSLGHYIFNTHRYRAQGVVTVEPALLSTAN